MTHTTTLREAGIDRATAVRHLVTVGKGARLTLIETITKAQGTDGLRQAYFMWAAALEDNRIGAKRLPDLQSQLFKVL